MRTHTLRGSHSLPDGAGRLPPQSVYRSLGPEAPLGPERCWEDRRPPPAFPEEQPFKGVGPIPQGGVSTPSRLRTPPGSTRLKPRTQAFASMMHIWVSVPCLANG